MSLLSYNQLVDLLDRGILDKSDYERINAASIDLVLGENIMLEVVEKPDSFGNYPEIDMLDKHANHLYPVKMGPEGITVPPGAVVLAQTVEIFHLPNNISAEYKLKSTQARNFFGHLLAGWCDAGWNGSVLTLEFVNHLQYHSTRIKPGMKCGQICFMEHAEVPADRSYAARGQYNGDRSVTAGKGLK